MRHGHATREHTRPVATGQNSLRPFNIANDGLIFDGKRQSSTEGKGLAPWCFLQIYSQWPGMPGAAAHKLTKSPIDRPKLGHSISRPAVGTRPGRCSQRDQNGNVSDWHKFSSNAAKEFIHSPNPERTGAESGHFAQCRFVHHDRWWRPCAGSHKRCAVIAERTRPRPKPVQLGYRAVNSGGFVGSVTRALRTKARTPRHN